MPPNGGATWHPRSPAGARHAGREGRRWLVLRRAATPIEVMQEPEALRLIRRLSWAAPERVAILAGILAYVRESEDQRIARAIGRESFDEDKALMSEARFRRLLQASGEELMEPLRRLVRLTKGKANVRDLSSSVLYWGDKVRKHWIFEYYGVSDSLRSSGTYRTQPPFLPKPDRQEPVPWPTFFSSTC